MYNIGRVVLARSYCSCCHFPVLPFSRLLVCFLGTNTTHFKSYPNLQNISASTSRISRNVMVICKYSAPTQQSKSSNLSVSSTNNYILPPSNLQLFQLSPTPTVDQRQRFRQQLILSNSDTRTLIIARLCEFVPNLETQSSHLTVDCPSTFSSDEFIQPWHQPVAR